MPDPIQKVRELVKAKTPFIYVVSDEERRICEEIIQNIAKPMNKEVWIWTCNTGLISYETKEDKKCKQFPEAMKEIIDLRVSEKKSGAIFLMLDPHIHINPSSARVMKDGYVNIMLGKHKDMIDNPRAYEGKVGSTKNIIFIAGRLAHVSNGIVEGLEPTIKTQVEVVDFPLPTKEELIDLIQKFIVSGKKIIKDADFNYSKEEVAEMARSLQGLSFLEAQRAVNECLINEKKLSISRLLEKKRSLVRQDDILEVIWNPPNISEVGGLDALKEFAHMYRGQFSEEAEKFGIESLRGLLFVGPPGCLRGDTLIYDPIDNTTKTVEERYNEGKDFNVISLSKDGPVVAEAKKPIKFKKEKMIEFTLEDGQKIAVTPAHRFWTQNGWKTSSEVFERLQADGVCLLPSNSELVQSIQTSGGLRSNKITQGSQSDCHHEFHSYDGQLHEVLNNDQGILPSQGDALLSCDALLHKDDQAGKQGYNHPYLQHDHLSKQDFYAHNNKELKLQNAEETYQPSQQKYGNVLQSLSEASQKDTSSLPPYLSLMSKPMVLSSSYTLQPLHNYPESGIVDVLAHQTHQELEQHDDQSNQLPCLLDQDFCLDGKVQEPSVSFLKSNLPSFNPPASAYINKKNTKLISIKQAKFVEDAVYFDFHVPKYENYAACGLWHHNTGKSKSAKSISNLWNIPCLRLDIGKVMAGIVGASEARMRQVIKTVEAAAPCVLWCDEVEKQMSGTGSSDRSDAGTLARVFGTLLTAMEEGMKGVILLATANDVSALPPEFIRRFDEVFFVDMPNPKERKEIFEVHLLKRNRDPKKLKLDMELLVEKTEAFVGSEIEKIVKQAIALAWKEKKKDVDNQCFLSVIKDMKPLSSTMKEKIQATRDWANGRARRANKEDKEGEKREMRGTSSISESTTDLLDQLVSQGKN